MTPPKDVAHDDTEMIETSNLDDEAAPLDEATAVEDEDKTHDQPFYIWGKRRRRTPSPKPPTPPAAYQHPLGPQPGESIFTVFDFATTTTDFQPATAPDHIPEDNESSSPSQVDTIKLELTLITRRARRMRQQKEKQDLRT